MKNKALKALFAVALSILTLTACDNTADVEVTPADAGVSPAETTPATTTADRENKSEETRIELYKTELNANGESYDCTVFMYFVNYEDENEDELYGMTAIEIAQNGVALSRKELRNENGISGTLFKRNGPNDHYFTIYNLERDVISFATPLTGGSDEKTVEMSAVYFTVSDDKELIQFERFFTDEEYEERMAWGFRITEPELCWFTVTEDCTFSGNTLTYHSNWDITSADNATGDIIYDIPLTFNFESFKITCDDPYYADTVYELY